MGVSRIRIFLGTTVVPPFLGFDEDAYDGIDEWKG
jgi:hypothetical protein